MKVNIKQEPDDENHPHVKLIIKKSPTKPSKIAEVMMQDMSEPSTDQLEGSSQETKEISTNKPVLATTLHTKKKDLKNKADSNKKSVVKNKKTSKKYKSLAVKPRAPRPLKKVQYVVFTI